MSLSRILPEFGARPGQNSITLTDVSLEDQKLASYEAGYQAGWDDSARANSDAGNQVSADFAQNMGDLSMTFSEAYAALLADVKPLLTQIVDAVLPAMARETLAPRILELIEAEMDTGTGRDVTLFAASEDCAFLRPLINGLDQTMSVELQSDSTLVAGQVRLSFGSAQEQELDTAALIAGIQTALHGFFDTQDTAEGEASSGNALDLDDMKETA
ncbi:MAG: flagellar biosynthesis protein [Pseudomonadota bacterium]